MYCKLHTQLLGHRSNCSGVNGQDAIAGCPVQRSAAYAVNATGLTVMIAVFASTAFIPTGLEVATGAGTAVAAQSVLQAIFGDQAVRTLAAKARTDLLDRVDALLAEEAARYTALTAVAADAGPTAERLRTAGAEVAAAHQEFGLATSPGHTPPGSAT